MPEKLILRVHYPLGPLDPLDPLGDRDLVLRTDRDWQVDVEPDRVNAARTEFEFELPLPRVYWSYKPVLRQGGTLLWSKGENYLAVPHRGRVRDVYPHFLDNPACAVCDLVHLAAPSGSRSHAVRVFTPPGYHENTLEHYPVLYMQDGQNLFFPNEAFAGHTWKIEETLHLLEAMSLIRRTIVVGVYPQDRLADYTQPGYADYGAYLVETVKPWVDANFRTRPDPEHTVVMGSSLGGVVSFYLAWQWPKVFGHAGCLSSTFGFQDDLLERVRSEDKRPIRIYLDSGWPGDNFEPTLAMRDRLLERGYRAGDELFYLAFPRAQHNEDSWAMRAHIPFQHFFRG